MKSPQAFYIDDVIDRIAERRTAFISIDHQYMFQNLGLSAATNPHVFKNFNTDYQIVTNMMRHHNIPVIHVAYDIENEDTICNLDRDSRKELHDHTQQFHYNAAEMTILAHGAPHQQIRNDMLHDIQNGEILYMKPSISAFDTDSPLHTYLQSRGIDTLICAGMYTEQCVKASMLDAIDLGYAVAAMADLIEGQSPKSDRMKRFEANKAYFTRNVPAAAITNACEFAEIIQSPLAMKLVA